METKNREKLLLIVTGAFAALYVLNLLVVSPLIDSWHSRTAEIANLKKQIAEGKRLARYDTSIHDQWNNMRANALPNNPTVAERQMFTAFDHWVNSGGVVEGSFRPQVQEGDTNFTTVDCRADVSGGLENMKDFLKGMSQDPLSDKVESFELTSKDDNGRQLVLGLSLSGLILTDSDPTTIAPTPEPKPAPSTDTTNANDPYQLISLNNIFDQSRIYRDTTTRIRPRVPKVETLTALGSGIDHGLGSAFFEGTAISYPKFYDQGSSVSEFKVVKVTPKTVTLTNSSSNTFILPTDGSESLRREDDGPWHLSGYIAAAPTTDTNSTATNATASTGGSAADDVIARLKKRREQE